MLPHCDGNWIDYNIVNRNNVMIIKYKPINNNGKR